VSDHNAQDVDWISKPAFWRAAEACLALYVAPRSEQTSKRQRALSLIESARGGADFEEIEVAIIYEAFEDQHALRGQDMSYVYARMNALLTGRDEHATN
jgi:hypothetical protein